jgi:hypothetical protein
MAEKRRYEAVPLTSYRTAACASGGRQAAGAWPRTAQAAERNLLLGLAELEICAGSLRTAAALTASDAAGEPA